MTSGKLVILTYTHLIIINYLSYEIGQIMCYSYKEKY
jgi:hypothetical protein